MISSRPISSQPIAALSRAIVDTFPQRGVLDAFNRANGVIGANWAADFLDNGQNAPTIDANTALASNSLIDYAEAAYSAAQYGESQEAYVDFAASGDAEIYVYTNIEKLFDATNSYISLSASSAGTFFVAYRRNGVSEATGSGSIAWSGLLGIGLRYSAYTRAITAWARRSDGWHKIATVDASGVTPPPGRYVGMGAVATSADVRLDNFGGGTLNAFPPATGTAVPTLGALTASGNGVVWVVGALSATLGELTLSASGNALASGAASPTLGALTLSASGAVRVSGQANVTLGALISAAGGDVDAAGAATPTLGAVTLSASGNVRAAGALNATLGALTATGTGTVRASGTASNTLGSLAGSGAGAVRVAGSASATLGALTASAAGTARAGGSLAATLGSLTASASGVVGGSGGFGTLVATLGALTATASGVVRVSGTGAQSLGTLVLSAGGTSGAVTYGGIEVSASVSRPVAVSVGVSDGVAVEVTI